MIHKETLARRKSFYISLIYVGLGTIALFSFSFRIFRESDFLDIMTSLIMLVTMPVSFISFGILYSEGREASLIALAVQFIIFLIFWYVVYRYMLNKNRREASSH